MNFMFREIIPMLASSVGEEKLNKLWGDFNWRCEEKLDGSRYILQFDSKGKPHLTSRRISVKTGKLVDKTENLRGYVVNDCPELANTILDGEIVGGSCFGDTVSLMGSSSARAQELLKNGMKVRYYLFDILMYQGMNFVKARMDFTSRREWLTKAINIPKLINPYWKVLTQLPNAKSSFDKIVKTGGEGVILKNICGLYTEGDRSKDWIKVKKIQTYDGVILDAYEGTGKYKNNLGSLSIGQYIKGKLVEVATVSGMNDIQRQDFWDNCLKYQGVCIEFEAQQKTKNRYRHPRFVRLRPDKSLKDCIF